MSEHNMRIQDAYRSTIDPTSARASQTGAKPAASSETSSGTNASEVAMSDKARELASVGAKDSMRIDALRSSIQNGTFKIDAHAIATKLVGHADGDGDGT